MLCTERVLADSWQSAVASKVTTAFDTNPSMSPNYPGGAWRFLFEPAYMLTGTDGAAGSGALSLGLRHPEVFSLVIAGHPTLDYASAARATDRRQLLAQLPFQEAQRHKLHSTIRRSRT